MGFICCAVALEQACAVEADGEWKESCMNKLKVWGHRSVSFRVSFGMEEKNSYCNIS